ncbi:MULTISPECIES: hypothetical protein [Peptoniphilus]|jgi:hypothetical protein|uniref:hypothetical protein n=1 Tax=Peptoniphilus TaxID=162289 RepID=UPI0008DA3054|nr:MULTISPECIES: hypothetical protein [Peptoniphilus]MBS6611078.1 hypothetical protein [Peptoniphilus harei]MDU1955439.1 hypothetical protein [Peptoniphilus lacydonensis]MDU2109264.1 hypothetical protein [Peptoniphilus lacydonensis]MDU2116158.1 hypothetical protein [Peptoniphilus lacydonensis]MDU3750650.1 hypothetical protein [Peptoniphilus rhinitidis]
MKKFLKIIGIVVLILVLMNLFNISIFIGNQKVDRHLILQGIRNFSLGDFFDKISKFIKEISNGIRKAVNSL